MIDDGCTMERTIIYLGGVEVITPGALLERMAGRP